ncbi:MAG: hypothetical protein HYY97_07795 [Rhodocyclales bacterium]|nr:hypothetical protein [Rhodocyclales bacterium]
MTNNKKSSRPSSCGRVEVDDPLEISEQTESDSGEGGHNPATLMSGKDYGNLAPGLPLSGLGTNDDFDVHAEFCQESD